MGIKKPFEERFWEKVQKTETCWLWTAALSAAGYGVINTGGRVQYAHRLSFEMSGVTIPDGLCLDHLCRNRACVNPAHLEPVTLMENIRRSPLSSVAINSAKTVCDRGHELVARKDGSGRDCPTCARWRGKGYYQNKKAKHRACPPDHVIIEGDHTYCQTCRKRPRRKAGG
jgi:hypothetical protein